MEQIEIEPYHMEEGYVTTVKLTRFTDTHPADAEFLEINPIPFRELGNISDPLKKYYTAKTHAADLKKQYESFRDECRRTHEEVQAILKQPTIAETAERHRLEMEEALKQKPEEIVQPDEKPAHEEPRKEALQGNAGELIKKESILKTTPEAQEPPAPQTPRQQAERIYNTAFDTLKGRTKVEEQDIMAAVMRAGVHPDDVRQVTGEFIELMKEKGAIDTPREKISRLLGGGKKKESGKK